MTKLLVETIGDFQLFDLSSGQLVRHTGFTVIEKTALFEERLGSDITVKTELPDEVTDTTWLETLEAADGDVDLAIASLTDGGTKRRQKTQPKADV